MLKKARIKFICIAMLAVVIVLTAIMVTVNVTNYAQVNATADRLTAMLAENGNRLRRHRDEPEDDRVPPEELPDGLQREEWFIPEGLGKETMYDTRFFIVTVTGDEYEANVEMIAAVDGLTAIEMAKSVLKSGKERGYAGDYRYRVAERDGETLVVFLDYSRQLTPTKNFLTTSCIVAAASIVLVFILVFFLSKRILQPVADAYERQKRFVTDAGHELKTPLTVISANNDLIRMMTGEEESTDVIRKQVAKLTGMVNDLTTLAKLDENAQYAFTKIDLSEATEEASDSLLSLYEKDGKTLENLVEGGIEINGDPSLINKLLMILFENAYKYSLTKTTVKLVKSGANAVLTVTNDADGVKKGNLDECFERFYRSAEARASKEGSGIGLSVAKEIVAVHKGKIAAEGKDGGVFEIKVVL